MSLPDGIASAAAPIIAVPPAIELHQVSVCFTVAKERIVSFKEYVLHRLKNRVEHQQLWALKAVDLEVRAGETLGLVGRNGAGKSTLLKVISRVLRPTQGRVIVRGRVAPLLELGAGFHFDLTGRENVFLNATLLGHPRGPVEERFDSVVRFAELEEFIDLPVRSYSSGMLARLGFSVATMFRPQILILDEVLAVGDASFQLKCIRRIQEFQARGTAILLASHDLSSVAQHCHRVAWIEDGTIVDIGEARGVLDRYSTAMVGAS